MIVRYGRILLSVMVWLSLYIVGSHNIYCDDQPKSNEKSLPTDFNEDFRDPFWKIGYIPIKGESTLDAQKVSQPTTRTILNKKEWILSKCKYGGTIERGNTRLAIINNQVVQKGDIIPVSDDGKIYKVKVVDIEAKSVKLALVE